MKKTNPAYETLKELSTEIHTLHSILSLLHWDQETYMPKGSITPRSEQIAMLSTIIHEKRTSRQFKNALEKLVHITSGKPKVKGLSKPQLCNLREWRREWIRETKLPKDFVKTFSQVTSEASQIWSTAKKENNFKLFAPFLKRIIQLCRQKADILGFSDHPYDALLETYEPCMTTKRVESIFSSLKTELVSLLKKIQNADQIDARFLHKKMDEKTQVSMGHLLLSKLPMETEYTRCDISAHPFSMALHPHDSRITTRILPNAFMSNIFSILHEAGHSLYEMGLPISYWGTPLCQAASLTVHESQSRFWETLIGKGLPFWNFFYPLLKKHSTKLLGAISLEKFYKAINKVSPSFIRVEADEVTYCLHVILRFEMEKQLIRGTLQVEDLPSAWNSSMKELFGIAPPTDTLGCLQDIHWSLGDFGYFPTYALGNLLAAQFSTAFAKQHPDWEEKMSSGDLIFIRDWLKKNVHQWGKMYNVEQLAKKVTGHAFSEKFYVSYLNKKYGRIYRFS